MAPERGDRSLPAGTEGLPRVFLQSLRTLFDILDDRRRGYVHLREIESRWRGAEARELPAGVMEGLRRAAPASGYLTFERFVLGLRAALPGAEPPGESGGGRRSTEKPPSPRGAEERRGKSGGQREPGQGQPRGRGEPAGPAGSAGSGQQRARLGAGIPDVRAAPTCGQRQSVGSADVQAAPMCGQCQSVAIADAWAVPTCRQHQSASNIKAWPSSKCGQCQSVASTNMWAAPKYRHH